MSALAAIFACLFNAPTLAIGEEHPKLSIKKWRPKDGRYTSPGKDFGERCMESDYFYIDLAKRSIGGNEWSCEVKRLVNTAHDTIRLNLKCYDLNLAVGLKMPEDRTFKEIMVLKRIGDNATSIRKSLNGKFEGPAWQADYCPGEAQQAHAEAEARTRAASEYKIPEQLLNPKLWRPKDGVYASPDTNFNDRCTKSGDVVISLTDGSISSGKADCKVVGLMSTGQTAVSLTCSPEAGKQASSERKKKGGGVKAAKAPETPRADIIRMTRIDDNTFHMQKTVDGEFKDDGSPVSYCPEEAQRAYAANKAKR